ncbi:LysR family transcriptional regulator [Burkholderia sp. MSMB1826]|uniref:LysR family transcriptional regulator n=1 Tax=Burkholderia sp. MSMB1826 TaxID=1637875 RepID=UPI001C54CFC4|nr:LysR family transcriptional regulator [Burkholderia sp. MSMB1826]
MTTFVKVVEAGSFTKAAYAMNLPKARVSQRISALENALGVRLLQRTTRVQQLTDDGRIYFAKCQAILAEIEEMESAMTGSTGSPKGVIRVEALASIARSILAPKLADFRRRYPGIRINLGCNDRISHLLEEGVDCAIRGGQLRDSTLVARHVCDVAFGLYASPAYLARFGRIDSEQVLRRADRISWSSSSEAVITDAVWRLITPDSVTEISEPASLMLDDPDAMIIAALHGAGVVAAAPFSVYTYVRRNELVPVLPEWHFPLRPIHIVYPTSKHLSARVRSFLDWVIDVLNTSPQLKMLPRDLA